LHTESVAEVLARALGGLLAINGELGHFLVLIVSRELEELATKKTQNLILKFISGTVGGYLTVF
jgi:acid stress-induced BolA-like protein IbaG/YrbA